MDTKLTLKLDKEVIKRAKKHAALQNISLSRMVESYLRTITASNQEYQNRPEITPFVKSLSTGSKISADVDYKSEFHDHQVEKHT